MKLAGEIHAGLPVGAGDLIDAVLHQHLETLVQELIQQLLGFPQPPAPHYRSFPPGQPLPQSFVGRGKHLLFRRESVLRTPVGRFHDQDIAGNRLQGFVDWIRADLEIAGV